MRSAPIPRYYFHLRDGADTLLDPEGVELAAGAVVASALKAARDCIAHDARAGRVDLDRRIVVEDEAGAAVYMIDFVDAVEISLPGRASPAKLRPVE